MAPLVTALFLLEPVSALKSFSPPENRCYLMRIFPIPKDFSDPIALRAGQPSAKLEEVRPNCWAPPSTTYVATPKSSSRTQIPTEKH